MFKCDKCPKEFETEQALNGHQKLHSPFKDHEGYAKLRGVCPECNKEMTASYVNTHLRTVHRKNVPKRPGRRMPAAAILGKTEQTGINFCPHCGANLKAFQMTQSIINEANRES